MRTSVGTTLAFWMLLSSSAAGSAPRDFAEHLSMLRTELRTLSSGYSGRGVWKSEIHALASTSRLSGAAAITKLDPPDSAHGSFQIRVHVQDYRVDVSANDASPRYIKANGDLREGRTLFADSQQQIWTGPGGLGATARRDRSHAHTVDLFPFRVVPVHLELARELEFPWPAHLRALNSSVDEPRVSRDPSGLVKIEVVQRTPSAPGKPDSVECRTLLLDPEPITGQSTSIRT